MQHVQKTFRQGHDIAVSLRDLKKKDLSSYKPVRETTELTDAVQAQLDQDGKDIEYQAMLNRYLERQDTLDENMLKAYAVIYSTYCSKTIQNRIEEHPDYETVIRDDPIELLKTIKVLMHETARARYPYASVTDAFTRLLNMKQMEHENLLDYVKRFKQNRDVLKSHVGSEILYKFIENTTEYQGETDVEKQKELKKEGLNKWMGYLLMRGSDHGKYGSLMLGLSSQYSMGHDQYPKDIVAATDVLSSHKFDNKVEKQKGQKSDDENSNASTIASTETSFAQTRGKIICYCCGKQGHTAPQCPMKNKIPKSEWAIRKAELHMQSVSEDDQDDSSIESGTATSKSSKTSRTSKSEKKQEWSGMQLTLHTSGTNMMDSMQNCITLDTGSTMSIFGNHELVENIQESPSKTEMLTNAGTRQCTRVADVPGFGKVWFHDSAIANIFGFANLVDKHRITYDSAKEDAFIVHVKGKQLKFKRTKNGLYQYEVPPSYKTNLEISNVIDTVAENRMGYTQRQFDRAKLARKLYHTIGTPTVSSFKAALRGNMIKNCPVTSKDVQIAEEIFGPSVSSLKGKSTRRAPKPVISDWIEIPKELILKHHEIELCMDTMFVNDVGMLTAIDRTIRFRSVVPIDSKKYTEYYRALDVILRHYNNAGFVVTTIHCDREYEGMMNDVKDDLGVNMNYTNAGDHVPEAERNNRTLKERIRAAYHRLPYKAIPKVMIKKLGMECARHLNIFPVKGGISSYYSPNTILKGQALDYTKHCVIPFGAYVQANHETTQTNSNAPRTLDGIYLRPLLNIQGGHEIMDLNSGEAITRARVTEIPITSVVIQAVEAMAHRQGFKSLKFKNRHKVIFFDTDWIAGVDYQPNPNTENEDEFDNDDDYINEPQDDEELHEDFTEIDQEELAETLAEGKEEEEEENNPTNENNDEIENRNDEENDEENLVSEDSHDDEEEIVPRRSQREVRSVDRYGFSQINSRKTVKFKDNIQELEYCHNLIAQVHPNPAMDMEYDGGAEATVIARNMYDLNQRVTIQGASLVQQYNLKKGLQIFGKEGETAAMKEMEQLHKRNCFTPVSVNDMTREERRKAMEALMFLAEKRDGSKKGRAVYNGKPTRNWIGKEDSASPTAALESVMLTCVIDAHEGRDVMCNDVPNTFIQTPLPPTKPGEARVTMKITGVLVDMLVQLSPEEYGRFVVYENGRKVIYVVVLKAIYGMLIASLLWYKKFKKDLEGEGFVFNPYDPCVANRQVKKSQHTIVFHVDDLKSSHADKKVNDEFEKWLQKKYGGHKAVTAHRGKKFDYLGMILDYSQKGKVNIDMTSYVRNMLESFPMKFSKLDTVRTPATETLFNQGQKKRQKLEKQQAEIFHTTVAKGLFLAKRARPDIQPTIAYLCTRVREPDEGDWEKLIRLLKYLNGTQEAKLVLSAESLSVVKWYVDAAFAVHGDFKSHTGAVMTFGQGAIQTMSRKQKLNTKSSTDAELVGADDAAVMILWTMLFLEAQGYKVEKNVLYQDNKSAILLEINGKKSAGKRSRALNIRYFFSQTKWKKVICKLNIVQQKI